MTFNFLGGLQISITVTKLARWLLIKPPLDTISSSSFYNKVMPVKARRSSVWMTDLLLPFKSQR